MTERSSDNYLFYGLFGLSAVLDLGGWLWAWVVLRVIDTPLILHFSDYTGISQIGGMAEIHGLGATGLLIVVLNFLMASSIRTSEHRWAKVLAGATLLVSALLFIALAAIISVNQ